VRSAGLRAGVGRAGRPRSASGLADDSRLRRAAHPSRQVTAGPSTSSGPSRAKSRDGRAPAPVSKPGPVDRVLNSPFPGDSGPDPARARQGSATCGREGPTRLSKRSSRARRFPCR